MPWPGKAWVHQPLSTTLTSHHVIQYEGSGLQTFCEAGPLAVMGCHRKTGSSKHFVKSCPFPSYDGTDSRWARHISVKANGLLRI